MHFGTIWQIYAMAIDVELWGHKQPPKQARLSQQRESTSDDGNDLIAISRLQKKKFEKKFFNDEVSAGKRSCVYQSKVLPKKPLIAMPKLIFTFRVQHRAFNVERKQSPDLFSDWSLEKTLSGPRNVNALIGPDWQSSVSMQLQKCHAIRLALFRQDTIFFLANCPQ